MLAAVDNKSTITTALWTRIHHSHVCLRCSLFVKGQLIWVFDVGFGHNLGIAPQQFKYIGRDSARGNTRNTCAHPENCRGLF
jgi:hypothetical protein